MRKTFFHGIGGVVSADIAVPEHESELRFYSSVLTTGDAPLWRDDLMNNLGAPIIGLGARVPEYDSLPLQWMPHFQVANVATSAAHAIEMGGKVVMQSETDDVQSQWAVITDKDGAAFGLIPALEGDSGHAEQDSRFGCISWLSLTASDAESSRDFYQRVVGWKAKSVSTENREGHATAFEMQVDDGASAAEVCQSQDEQKTLPPVWLIHLPVGDLAESLRRVREAGGEVIQESGETKQAVVRDPVGVYFALQAG